LNTTEREMLADVIEASLRVVERHHFYEWTQGIFQALLPHEILICGVDDGAPDAFNMHQFSGTRYFRAEHFEAVCQPRDGLFARIVSLWRESDRPFLFPVDRPSPKVSAELVELIMKNELKNVAAHGVRGAAKRLVGFYSFSRVPPEALCGHTAHVAEIVVPYVHMTLLRVLAHEQRVNGHPLRGNRHITRREMEILKWIKAGKTTSDIAEILTLSPWTVKNHVRAALRKLSAETRSHAVAKAISLGILDPMD